MSKTSTEISEIEIPPSLDEAVAAFKDLKAAFIKLKRHEEHTLDGSTLFWKMCQLLKICKIKQRDRHWLYQKKWSNLSENIKWWRKNILFFLIRENIRCSFQKN
jgi:hypothetical protein